MRPRRPRIVAVMETAFDTLAASKALREAGFDQRQAEAVAGAMREAVTADRAALATKADLYRALLIQGAAIISVIAALLAFA